MVHHVEGDAKWTDGCASVRVFFFQEEEETRWNQTMQSKEWCGRQARAVEMGFLEKNNACVSLVAWVEKSLCTCEAVDID